MLTKSSPILANPDFRSLQLVRILVFVALLAQSVIIGWQIYQLTHDAFLLGLMGLAEAVPAIGCSFISGHFVDTHFPSRILRSAVFLLFINSAVLLFAMGHSLVSADLRLTALYFAIFMSGVGRAFVSPAINTLIPQLIPRDQMSAASAWSSSAYQVASILGPALGGLVYGFAGPLWAFVLPVFFLLMAYLGSFRLSARAQGIRSQVEREPFLQSVRSGIAFTFRHKTLLSTMTLDMFSVLFGGAVAVLPIFADQVLHVGSSGLGLLRAAPATGSAVMLLVLAFRPMKVISGKTLLWVVAGFGASTVAFALSGNLPLALLFLALSGAFDGVSMVIRGTILQWLTPDHMRGRVSALNSVFITSSNELGAFESGLAATAMGLIPSVLFGGTMTLLIVAITAWRVPDLRKMRLQ